LFSIAPNTATPTTPPILRKKLTAAVAVPKYSGPTAACTVSTNVCRRSPNPTPAGINIPTSWPKVLFASRRMNKPCREVKTNQIRASRTHHTIPSVSTHVPVLITQRYVPVLAMTIPEDIEKTTSASISGNILSPLVVASSPMTI
jgi:hypothetical protein